MSTFGDGLYGDGFYGGPTGNLVQVDVRVAPARVRARVLVGTSGPGTAVTTGPSRSTDVVEPTRYRAAATADDTRRRAAAGTGPSTARDRVDVNESRPSHLVGPNRKE